MTGYNKPNKDDKMKTKQKENVKKHYFNVFLGIIIALVIYLGLNFLNVTINIWYFLFTILLLLIYFELLDQGKK